MIRSPLRRLVAAAVLCAVSAGCRGEASVDAPSLDAPPGDAEDEANLPLAAAIEPQHIQLRTYDGSGEVVHPDAVGFDKPWHGRRYWYSITPYPAGDQQYENPSIYLGARTSEWTVPSHVANPIVLPPASGYLSDPDLSYDPAANELRLYYRETVPGVDRVYLARSSDGEHWQPARLALEAPRFALISPAVVREAEGTWRMWTVDAGPNGCRAAAGEISLEERRSVDGLTWTAPSPVALRLRGSIPWHWDVQYIPAKHEYWALVAAYPEGATCIATAVYFATSPDGTTWKVSPTPLLAPGNPVPALRDVVYRSTFRYHEKSDAVTVWFSGARFESSRFTWSLATARYPLRELLRRVGQPGSVSGERNLTPLPMAAPDSGAIAEFVRRFP